LTPSAVASSRTVGSRSPGASRPSAIPASIVPAMVAAPAPGPILCTRGIINMYYNKDSRSRRRFRRPVAAGRADPAGGPEQAGTGRGAGLSRAAGVTGLDQAAGRAGTTAGPATAAGAGQRAPGRARRWAAAMNPGLSAELWLVQIGIFANMLGYGAVLPFEI